MATDLSHLPCPCGRSSDAFSVDPDTLWGHCFRGSCTSGGTKHNFKPGSFTIEGVELPTAPEETELDHAPKKTAGDFATLTTVFHAWPARSLSEETIKRYKVDVGGPNAKYEARYPLYGVDGVHRANKVRYPEKEFRHEGDVRTPGLGLFGRHAFAPGSAKAITVTEGQDDAMAVFQMTGSRYPAVSVHSSSTAERDVRADFEYLNSFETIVFCFDDDEAGRKAVKACANVGFPIGKVKVLTLRKHKDPNDYLRQKDSEAFSREWWAAPVHKPDGLITGPELWETMMNRRQSFATGYPWEGLNRLTFGVRLSEMVIVWADSGVGKTTVLKHLEHKLLTDPEIIEKGYGVGFLHLEEPNGDTALGLLSVHNGVPYHLPDVERPEAELRAAYDAVLNNDRVVIWDHFGSNSVDAVLDKVRHMAALGCKYIVLDHLSIIVSDQSGDERKQLDEIATKLKTLTMELDLAVIAVIHSNRAGQIRGTAGVEQLANIVVRLTREKLDKNEWRRNITVVSVEKNRFCGYTGPACHLFYNSETARLSELDDVEVGIYEGGGSASADEVWA